MSSHMMFTESRKYTSFPKETTFSLAPNSKIAIPLKNNLEILPWNFHRRSRSIIYYLKSPEYDTNTGLQLKDCPGS